MKNKLKVLGIIALIAVIEFSFIACGGDDDDDGGRVSVPSQLVGEWNSSDGQGSIIIKSDGEINSLRYKLFFFILSSSKLGPTSGTIVFGYQSELIGPSGSFSYSISGNTMTISNSDYYDFPNGTYQRGSGGNNNNNTMTWMKVTNSPFTGIEAIAYGNNTFVAVDGNSKIGYSTDNGVTWATVANTTFGTESIYTIAFGNGTFVAGGDNNKIAYSSDGVTWTAAQMKPVSGSIRAIAFGNGTFVAGGVISRMVYSSDGITWTAAATNANTGGSDIEAIAFGNGTFVAGIYGDSIAYSTDNGISWTTKNVSSIFDNRGIRTIAYGNGRFVAGGDKGKIATSTDGITWTPVTTTALGTSIWSIAFGNGIFVGGGLGDPFAQMAYSTDGVTWTSFQTGTTQSGYWNAIGFGNGRFVAGYSYGGIDYSTGGGSGNSNPQTATYTGTASGTAYTLKITENTARYAAQKGDAYELTGGTKKSTGTVNNVSGGVLTLKPSNATSTFTATVSGSSITALNGTITWTDKTTATAPGAFTGGTTPGTDPGTGSGGTVTFTDIPAKYNGKYASFTAQSYGADTTVTLGGYQSIDSTLSRILNGRVSIPAWNLNTANPLEGPVRYSGNDTFDVFSIAIYEASTFRENALAGTSNFLASGVFTSVKFSNGSATVSRNNAIQWTDN